MQGLAFYWGTSEWSAQPPALKPLTHHPVYSYTFLGSSENMEGWVAVTLPPMRTRSEAQIAEALHYADKASMVPQAMDRGGH